MPGEFVSFNELTEMAREVHRVAKEKGWYDQPETTHQFIMRSVANIHGEASELWEAERKGHCDADCDKAIKMREICVMPLTCLEEELADIIIRTLDVAAHLGVNIGACVASKHAYNQTREYRHGGKTA